jgi:hypothetical protein
VLQSLWFKAVLLCVGTGKGRAKTETVNKVKNQKEPLCEKWPRGSGYSAELSTRQKAVHY